MKDQPRCEALWQHYAGSPLYSGPASILWLNWGWKEMPLVKSRQHEEFHKAAMGSYNSTEASLTIQFQVYVSCKGSID